MKLTSKMCAELPVGTWVVIKRWWRGLNGALIVQYVRLPDKPSRQSWMRCVRFRGETHLSENMPPWREANNDDVLDVRIIKPSAKVQP